MKQPKPQTQLRILSSNLYHTLKKHYYWYLSNTNFAQKIQSGKLPYKIFPHQTLLLRKLENIDMWMQHNKVENLKLAIKHLNRLVIEPGQTFSYWRQIRKPTKDKGYLEGMFLHNGNVTSGVGGGLCQLSNLIYWLTLHTPLTVIERYRHNYDVFPDTNRTQPFGSGATCAYPNIDLVIKNTTDQIFQLCLEVTNTHLVGTWLSNKPIKFKYEIFEKDHKIKHEWWGGYTRNNKLFRKVVDKETGNFLAEEFVTSNHAIMMYNPLLAPLTHPLPKIM